MDSAALRVAALWVAWLLVMLFHVELGLMPLFHGCSVEMQTRVPARRLPAIFLSMLVYFLLPLFAMLLAVHAFTEPEGWSASGSWRAFQFFLATIYTVTNIGHFLADLCIPDSRFDQVILMGVLTAIGLLLNWHAWLWWAP